MKLKFTFLVMLLCVTNIFAQTPSQQLSQLFSDFRSMQANFVQNSYDSTGSLLQKSTGTMALQRPGKFRWALSSPTKQLIIADGNYIWIYDPDLQQVSKQTINSSQNTNPASLLSGSTDALQQRFNITKINKNDGSEWFELKPVAKNDMFQWIQLGFKNNMLINMILSDNLGQKSTVTFSQVKTNNSLDSNLFNFNPPKGTDIFNQ